MTSHRCHSCCACCWLCWRLTFSLLLNCACANTTVHSFLHAAQGCNWTISPIPDPSETLEDACEGSVRVDLQLVLPSAASRKESKLLLPAGRSADSSSASSYASSELSSQGSGVQDGAAGAVVLQVKEDATSTQPSAAAPPAAASASGAGTAAVSAASCSAAASAARPANSGGQGSSTAAATAGEAAALVDADDEGLCTICYDEQATCVLMECGHGGYCWRCAHVLFARPPSECPVCRQSIMQVSPVLCVFVLVPACVCVNLSLPQW